MSDFFYKNIISFSEISDITDSKKYIELPADWSVVVTDIKGSTKAIESGQYKNVNVVGVTTIIATENACAGINIPAVFGGDGATLFIPNKYTESVSKALAYSRLKAKTEFDLDLRIAIIPITEIRRLHKNIFIAKMKLSGETYIAMASGDGLHCAENLTKQSDQFLIPDSMQALGTHDGLECRWNPIESQNGEILSIVIMSKQNNSYVQFQKIIFDLQTIVPGFGLIKSNKLSLAWPPIHLMKEIQSKYSGFWRWVMYVLVVSKIYFLTVIVRHQIKKADSLVSKYLDELSKNTDFIKYEGNLKMVIDVSMSQKNDIIKYLDQVENENKIIYGIHSSNTAMMTCSIKSIKNHIHYVDGGDGGYAMASRALKAKSNNKPKQL